MASGKGVPHRVWGSKASGWGEMELLEHLLCHFTVVGSGPEPESPSFNGECIFWVAWDKRCSLQHWHIESKTQTCSTYLWVASQHTCTRAIVFLVASGEILVFWLFFFMFHFSQHWGEGFSSVHGPNCQALTSSSVAFSSATFYAAASDQNVRGSVPPACGTVYPCPYADHGSLG